MTKVKKIDDFMEEQDAMTGDQTDALFEMSNVYLEMLKKIELSGIALHRIDEMATISRPTDNMPRKAKVMVYGENDAQGTKIPHFHIQIDNGSVELEVKFEHIRNMEIWRTKGNYPKRWDGITDVRDRIVAWFDEVSAKNFGVSNLQRMIMAWNDGNPTNEIDEAFTK